MNTWAIIPLVSCFAYATLLVLILSQAKTRLNRIFGTFLFACTVWSFSSFMLTNNTSATTQALIFWNNIVLVVALLSTIIYYHFIRVYIGKSAGIVAYVGYALALTTLALSLGGLGVRDAYFVAGYLHHDVGPWVIIMFSAWLPITAITMWMLVRRYRVLKDPNERNKVLYLMVGWGVVSIYSPLNANVPLLAGLPTDHIGTLVNAVIISFAITKYQLLDIRFVVRKGLANFIFLTGIFGLYTGAILLTLQLFSGQLIIGIFSAVAGVTILLGMLAQRMRYFILRQIDHLFHGETHIYRQSLLGFSSKMGNILDLDAVANEMLSTICKALRLRQAKLLIQEADSGDFTTQFAYPPAKEEASVEFLLSADSPVVAWLAKQGTPLNLEQIASIPQFKALWMAEKEALAASGLELLCPVKSRDKLIGILALSKKQAGTLYNPEDIELVISMANQAAIVIENAQLYTHATMRANTDGLTSLYNHRHFHERIEQEIARGSRFGTIFSLIMIDIDLFKTYNDIHGHLAGDEILRKIAMYIKAPIRTLDMAFRYGGEEFAIILPETRLDDAYKVAERIRKTIAAKISSRTTPITASLGIASWPIDGVMKEEIISCADAALYRAKQTGRNRTYLSSEVTKPATLLIGVELEAQSRALSIIYALAATVDAKDHYTYGHSKKVSEFSVALAEALALPQDRIDTIRAAGLLHDIGKVGIPDSILNKKGPLTDEEWEPVREHPKLGVEILRHVIDLVNCLPAILHHHEHYNGSGYPAGLKGDNIPLEARILALVDAYDAITSLRPYHEQISTQEALDEIKRCAGTQFDPELVNAFCKIMKLTPSKRLEIK